MNDKTRKWRKKTIKVEDRNKTSIEDRKAKGSQLKGKRFNKGKKGSRSNYKKKQVQIDEIKNKGKPSNDDLKYQPKLETVTEESQKKIIHELIDESLEPQDSFFESESSSTSIEDDGDRKSPVVVNVFGPNDNGSKPPGSGPKPPPVEDAPHSFSKPAPTAVKTLQIPIESDYDPPEARHNYEYGIGFSLLCLVFLISIGIAFSLEERATTECTFKVRPYNVSWVTREKCDAFYEAWEDKPDHNDKRLTFLFLRKCWEHFDQEDYHTERLECIRLPDPGMFEKYYRLYPYTPSALLFLAMLLMYYYWPPENVPEALFLTVTQEYVDDYTHLDMRNDYMKRVDLKHPHPHLSEIKISVNIPKRYKYRIVGDDVWVNYAGPKRLTISNEIYHQVRSNRVMRLDVSNAILWEKVNYACENINTVNLNRYEEEHVVTNTALYCYLVGLAERDDLDTLPFRRAPRVTA